MGRIEIQQPHCLQVQTNVGLSYGYNQEWFSDGWQRLAGCGPTTAAQMIAYVTRNKEQKGLHYLTVSEALRYMEQLWPYLKPHYGGLYKTRWFEMGLQKYIDEHDLPYEVRSLHIYPFKINRYSAEVVGEFIWKGLELDSPVAFLNRHKGNEEGLSTWHWVPLISLQKTVRNYRGVVYDEEIERYFSLNDWLDDNILGGGFVYLAPKQ